MTYDDDGVASFSRREFTRAVVPTKSFGSVIGVGLKKGEASAQRCFVLPAEDTLYHKY